MIQTLQFFTPDAVFISFPNRIMKQKIVIIQRIFSSYRKAVYDKLQQKTDLTILHGDNNSGIKTVETGYSSKVKVKSYGKNDTQVYINAFKKLKEIKPLIVIHEFAVGIISLPLTLIWCRVNKAKFVLWSHGYNRKKGFNPKNNIADKYRLWLIKKADSLILYGDSDKKLLSAYINPEKIFVAKNTLDTDTLLKIHRMLVTEGRDEVKKRLHFIAKYNIIYIGRLLKEKLPDLLIKMIDDLSPEVKNSLCIHYVGDGPARADLEELINSNLSYKNSVKFHGKVYDDERTGELLYAADIMILPGEIGLSVNHALIFQCPVFTFEKNESGPWHGPEEDYIINGLTGYKVKEQTSSELGRTVDQYLKDTGLQRSMRDKIEVFVKKELLVENMVGGISDCINYVNGLYAQK
jgi:glycosyltransferase involved in cell wall biosynthesis